MTQLHHNTRTFKIQHFGIVYQDSKGRPCPLQRPISSFAQAVRNPNECSSLHIATILDLLTSIHLPPTVPCPWLQCWHLSPSTYVQFQHGHSLLHQVMVSTHPVHAQKSSNTLLAIKYPKTNKHRSLAYHSIYNRLHKPYPPSGGTSFMLHCMCIPMWQPPPTSQTLCYVVTTLISHFSSATIPTYSTCTCPYSIPMTILCASMQESYSSCQIWTMDTPLVHSSITDAFHAFKKNSFLFYLHSNFLPGFSFVRVHDTIASQYQDIQNATFWYSVSGFQRPSMPSSISHSLICIGSKQS